MSGVFILLLLFIIAIIRDLSQRQLEAINIIFVLIGALCAPLVVIGTFFTTKDYSDMGFQVCAFITFFEVLGIAYLYITRD